MKNLSRSEIREIKNNQSELYMENDNFKVIIPYTHDAVKIYGKGTSWCVSWAKDEDYQFYNKTGKILLILKKNVHIKDNTEIDDVCYKVSMWMPYQKYLPLLDSGIIKNPTITNYDKFIQSSIPFFPEIESAEHIGSLFTVRAVPPRVEDTDARPTQVTQIDENTITIFSGKITV